ncbi:prp38 [Ilyonectria robusta]
MSRFKSDTVHADASRFLDERGSNAALAPNGLNPATIMEKAVKDRIVDSYFYKEQCFALNEADIVDRVVEHVNFIGGTHGATQKPSPFLCLAFKLLELGPSDAILQEYLQYGGEAFKYLRALACFYVRLTRKAKDVHTLLEPFLEDRRKLRRKGRAGTSLTFVDEFVDDLLTKDRICATSLWKMPKREVLEDLELLDPRGIYLHLDFLTKKVGATTYCSKGPLRRAALRTFLHFLGSDATIIPRSSHQGA